MSCIAVLRFPLRDSYPESTGSFVSGWSPAFFLIGCSCNSLEPNLEPRVFQSRTQSPQALWSAGRRKEPENSGLEIKSFRLCQ